MSTTSIAINSAGANLLRALLQQVDQLQKPMQQLSQSEQQKVIFHLREAVETCVKKLVETFAAAEFARIPATVESVTFKDGVKAVLQLSKGEIGTHALADATGNQALVVIANHREFLEGVEDVKAKADQGELFEQIEDDTPLAEGVPEAVHALLASVDVHVSLESVRQWTEAEVNVATEWAQAYANTPDDQVCTIARPHWLPMPEPAKAAA